jgi:hypothetical protein
MEKALRSSSLFAQLGVFLLTVVAPAWPGTSPVASTQSPHGPMQMACINCHTPNAWMPIRSHPEFDHGKTSYPLRGMHVNVPCQECHVNPVFANTASNCQDCHADIHRRNNGAQCEACHRVNGWQVSIHSIKDHQDRFPLVGAHAAVDCYSCHKVGAIGRFSRLGLSTDCVSCHFAAYLKTSSPNHRAMGFSTDCRQCHTMMDSWVIAVSSRAKRRR